MSYEVKPEIIDKFWDILEYILRSLMPEKPNELDNKEGSYLMQYVQERLSEMIERFENHKQIPIMNVVMYADHAGKTDIYFRGSSEAEILINFKLPEAARLIKDALGEWEKKLEEPHKPMGGAGVEYDALRQHIGKLND